MPGLDATLRAHLVAFVQRLRTLELRKSPSISETLNVLLKYESDIEATARQIETLVRELILDFLTIARGAGLGIVPGDALDVFAALQATGYADRETVHASLRRLLARSDAERERFDLAFARYFGCAGATAWDDFA